MPNRDLLMELCVSNNLVVSNTFFDKPDEAKVTYRHLGTEPLEPVTEAKFTQIDHVLWPATQQHLVKDCWSDRTAAISSHHFVTICC